MADAINRKPNSQSYLRQIQQEKAKYKRELMQAQKEDMKAVRDYYSDQTKQLEAEAAAAVLDIKQEARQMAEADRIAKQEYQAQLAESKKLERESRLPANSYEKTAVENSVEKKKLYSDRPQRAPLIQNYRSQETDNFYRVQDRGSRISEGPGYYTIEAYAPEHEKDNLRVSIQRNKAVISGQRKFTDSADGGDKEIKNNNYQSFREEFKFDRPVSGEGMKRERIGDFVRFTIPKLEAVGGWDEET